MTADFLADLRAALGLTLGTPTGLSAEEALLDRVRGVVSHCRDLDTLARDLAAALEELKPYLGGASTRNLRELLTRARALGVAP